MIKPFPVGDIQSSLETTIPGSVVGATDRAVLLRPDRLVDACRHLQTAPGLQFDFLCHITAVDYVDYFELTYELTSLQRRHRATLKVRLFDRQDPQVPSVLSVWRGADFQEREIWDLMGVRFVGHPDLRRILLWDGFAGHPLRKDYFYENVPGKYADQD